MPRSGKTMSQKHIWSAHERQGLEKKGWRTQNPMKAMKDQRTPGGSDRCIAERKRMSSLEYELLTKDQLKTKDGT